jgi:hypothetical protein
MREVSLDDKPEMQTIQEDQVLKPGGHVRQDSLEKNALAQIKTVSSEGSADANGLVGATTVNSLIDRHDMYRGLGRIETKDIRQKAHEI